MTTPGGDEYFVHKKSYSIKEFLLFKLDRTLALLGIVGMGVAAVVCDISPQSQSIITNILYILGVYTGVRGASSGNNNNQQK